MSDPRKIVPIEDLRKRAAERGQALEALSEDAIRELADELRRELGDLPDVRMDRVALAKARISKGYYTGERIAEGLLAALRGPTPPAPIPLRDEAAGGPKPDRDSEADAVDDPEACGEDDAFEGNDRPNGREPERR